MQDADLDPQQIPRHRRRRADDLRRHQRRRRGGRQRLQRDPPPDRHRAAVSRVIPRPPQPRGGHDVDPERLTHRPRSRRSDRTGPSAELPTMPDPDRRSPPDRPGPRRPPARRAPPRRGPAWSSAVNSYRLARRHGELRRRPRGHRGHLQVSGFSVELIGPRRLRRQVHRREHQHDDRPLHLRHAPVPPVHFNTFPNTDFIASDSSFTRPFVTTLTHGQQFGLDHVTYSVASGTPLGPVTVSLQAAGTPRSRTSTAPRPVHLVQRHASRYSAVPEPSSVCLLLTVLIGAFLVVRGRGRPA